MDFVAWGVRGFSRPICGDAMIVSPLHRDGTPRPLTPDIDGASFLRAVAHKEPTYPELVRRNQYGALTVLACETGGRWHHRALSTVSTLIEAKTQTIAPLLRQAAALAYHRRWWGILSTALQRTVATSLLVWGSCPAQARNPRSVTCCRSRWRSRRLAASRCGTIRRKWGQAAQNWNSATQVD